MTSKVLLSRKEFFSATRALTIRGASEQENIAAYGKAHQLHGHDYIVEAFYKGNVAADDGMIVNLYDLKPYLFRASRYFDGVFLNDLMEFKTTPPTIENLIHCFWSFLPPVIDNGHLKRLRIDESPHLWAVKTIDTMFLTRSYEFCAAHRLHSPDLSPEENQRRYGKCNNPSGHGHNYKVDVTLQGDINPQSGLLIALPVLDDIVEKAILARFDHHHLNVDCPEFANLVPTSENFAQVIFDILDPLLKTDQAHLAKIGLHETYKNYFEVER